MKSTSRKPAVIGRRVMLVSLLSSFVATAARTPAYAIDLLKEAEDAVQGLGGGSSGGLTDKEIGAGLTEALRVGTERVVQQVGAVDGYNLDEAIHIPLPGSLKDVQKALKTIGMSEMADDLELRLNRAAETAAPEAQELFWEAIDKMTFDDVQKIYNGPDDAATRYFEKQMTPKLAKRMRPIVDQSLAEVGAIQSYDAMMTEYKSIPFVPDAKADLTNYVVDEGMDGIFHYVAKEEAAIRNNPAARSTELLKKVFGSN